VKAVTDVCRVFICDDQPQLRQAVSEFLADLDGFESVGEAGDGDGCVIGLRATQPDLLILDVSMPQGGPALAAKAKKIVPHIKIVVFSAYENRNVEDEMRLAGADHYVVKTGRLRPLRDALYMAAGSTPTA
jgi:two-component system nitrate/nitrite response regulator NarL